MIRRSSSRRRMAGSPDPSHRDALIGAMIVGVSLILMFPQPSWADNPPLDDDDDGDMGSFSVALSAPSDLASPKYRKIGLDGSPLPDERPEESEESDRPKEESYVDALNLNLRHETTDVYIPVPASELVLQVRRNSASESWGPLPGSRSENMRPELPFGPGWRSNLGAGIKFYTITTHSIGSYRCEGYAYVTDEHGATFRFAMLPRDPPYIAVATEEGELEQPLALDSIRLDVRNNCGLHPLPTSRHEIDACRATLVKSAQGFVFQKKFGTTLIFDDMEGDPPPVWEVRSGSTTIERIGYGRLRSVTDKYGNKLLYEYDQGKPVPRRITVAGNPKLALEIACDANDRVQSVKDPNGNYVVYQYGQGSSGLSALSVVRRGAPSATGTGGLQTVQYSYVRFAELETRWLPPLMWSVAPDPPKDYDHFEISAISTSGPDEGECTYGFEYKPDDTKENYINSDAFTGYYTLMGQPMYVSKVNLPGGQVVDFHNYSKIRLKFGGSSAGQVEAAIDSATRLTEVIDIHENKRTYSFGVGSLEEVAECKYESAGEWEDKFWNDRPRLLTCDEMVIEFYGGSSGPKIGEERVIYDPKRVLLPVKVVDFSSTETGFVYGDLVDLARWSRLETRTGAIAPYHVEPTQVTNAIGGVKHMAYHQGWRVLTSLKDPEGRVTQYALDALDGGASKYGRREEEIIRNVEGGPVVQRTEWVYDDEVAGGSMPAFVRQKVVHTITGDPAWAKAHRTIYEPYTDDGGQLYGWVGREAVDVNDNGAIDEGTDDVKVYRYDANGNKTASRDARGNWTYFKYDAANRLTDVVYPPATGPDDSGAPRKQFGYDGRGNKIGERDERGVRKQFRYDEINRLIGETIDLDGDEVFEGRDQDLVTDYVYQDSSSGGVWKKLVIDPNEHTSTLEYDALGRLKREIAPIGNYQTTYEYGANSGATVFDSSAFKPTLVVDRRAFERRVSYDGLFRAVTNEVEFLPGVFARTITAYDAVGNPTAVIDPLGKRTETDYDALNRPTHVRFAVGTADAASQETRYTGTGRAYLKIDELLRETETRYDAAGRPTHVMGPTVFDAAGGANGRPTTVTVYDAAGNVTNTINPRGGVWQFGYDERNRKISETQPSVFDFDAGQMLNPVLAWHYDAVGNVTNTIDARGKSTDTVYDKASRPLQVLGPPVPLIGGGEVRPLTVTTYDGNGNVTSVTDPNTHAVTNLYDALNRLVWTHDGEGIQVAYEYDPMGNRTAVIDGKNQRTDFGYDGLNRNLWVADATGQTNAYLFDAVNKIGRIDASGRQTAYGYDARHRLTSVVYSGRSEDDRAYSYDPVGNLLSVTEPNKAGLADVAYGYDGLNRVTGEVSSGVTNAYGYDLAGNRVTADYGVGAADPRHLDSTYDALNRLDTLIEGGRTNQYRYDLAGNIRTRVLPNGDSVLRAYDALNRAVLVENRRAGGGLLSGYDIGHDPLGNVVRISEDYPTNSLPDRVVINAYDAANRLTNETVVTDNGNVSTTYAFDGAHNRTGKIVSGGQNPGTWSYGYNGLNQMTNFTGPSGTVTFAYDLGGNRTNRIAAGGSDTYAYDYENRLVELDLNTAGAGTNGTYRYTYDYRTRRVLRDESLAEGVSTRIAFSGGTSIREYEGTNSSPAVEYIRGSDYGGGIGGILYTLRDGDPAFTFFNGRGDVVAKTDDSGSLTFLAAYEAFGTRTAEQGATQDRQKASTKDEDPTGLLNEGFRYRDIETGAFITRDPLGFVDGPNLYTYVVQNPWTKVDPEGLETKKQLEEKKHQAAKTRDAKIAAYYKEHGSNKLSRDPSAVGKIKADYERTASRLDKRIDRIEQTAKVAGAVADLEAKYFELTGGGHSRMQVPTTDTLDDTATAHAGYFQLNERLGATRNLAEVWGTLAGCRLAEMGFSFLGKQFARGSVQNLSHILGRVVG